MINGIEQEVEIIKIQNSKKNYEVNVPSGIYEFFFIPENIPSQLKKIIGVRTDVTV